MATSFLTQAQKDVVDGLTESIHATFSVPILAIKINKKTSLASNPNFNSIYRQGQTNVTEEEQSREFQARVRYIKAGEELFAETDGSSSTSNQSRIILPAGSVKIKVDYDAHLFIEEAKRIEISGERYVVFHRPRKIGFFDKSKFWEYYLAPIS